MRKQSYKWKAMFVLAAVLMWMCVIGAAAGEGSNDNSLADLGILTEGAEVFPELEYGVTEYEVRVPAGTQALELSPVPTNGNAQIAGITGTEIVNGEATVEILVEAENGERYPYYLHVTEVGGTAAVPETEPVPQTEPETEPESETEDPRYVKVDRTTLQEAENTINALKDETRSYRDRSVMLMRLLYGMIAFSVVLLFIVINLLLKKKDMKAELEEYRGYGYAQQAGYPENGGYSGEYDAGYRQEPDPYEEEQASGRRRGRRKQRGTQAYEGNMQEQQERYTDAHRQERHAAADRQQMTDQMQERRADSRQQESGPQLQVYQPEPPVVRDDPSTVPKPQTAKKKAKKMPEYQQPQQQDYSRQPRQDKAKNVEITMIDL